MRVYGDEHAKVVTANSQGSGLPGGFKQLQQDTQDLEVFLLKLLNILLPELQAASMTQPLLKDVHWLICLASYVSAA